MKIPRVLMTAWLFLLWFLLMPIVLLTPYSNCWYYAVKRLVFEGFVGKVVPIASKRWRGYHCVYQDVDGVMWEYTMKKIPRNLPWWKLIIYRGVERRYKGKI